MVDELREQTKRWYEHQSGEIYLTDAINAYAKGRAVMAKSFKAIGMTPETPRTTSLPSSRSRWLTPPTGR